MSIELHNSRRIAQTDNEVLCQLPESAPRQLCVAQHTYSWKIGCERRRCKTAKQRNRSASPGSDINGIVLATRAWTESVRI